jgi:hypothetical protein
MFLSHYFTQGSTLGRYFYACNLVVQRSLIYGTSESRTLVRQFRKHGQLNNARNQLEDDIVEPLSHEQGGDIDLLHERLAP